MKRSNTSSRNVRRVVACLAMAALVAACGSDDSPSTSDSTSETTPAPAASTADSTPDETSAAPSGDVCADKEALRDSVAALADVDLVAEGTNGAKSAISAVKDDLAALRSSAGSELEPEVQAVQDAVDDLETAVGNLDSGGATEAVTAVSDLVTSSGTLLDSLEAGACGEAAPSTT